MSPSASAPASDNPADHAAALAAGADFAAVKPFDRDTLALICEKTGRFQLVQNDDGKESLRQAASPAQADRHSAP